MLRIKIASILSKRLLPNFSSDVMDWHRLWRRDDGEDDEADDDGGSQ